MPSETEVNKGKGKGTVKASSLPISGHQSPLRGVENHKTLSLYKDRQGLFRTRIPGTGHPGHSGGWQYTEGKHTHSAIHLPIQQKPQVRVLEGYGSTSSAPPTPQRSIQMENGKQEVQPSITLGRTWSKFPEYMSQGDTLQRSYGNSQMMEFQQAVQTPGGEGNQNKGKSSHYPSYRRKS
ncbi:hypothetical protein O181_066719 [Austropuccinia psidii MF-1]|uniref:Uncharacterized protein n=1 Tax=Austropuccinia psidii MF-1 TaxID=1389203 RepID=A0A9Q3I5T9_9BASI|nr:hypothetical protein [Austropuccinia psidii MF-1]